MINWGTVLIALGSAVVAVLVNIAITLMTRNEMLGFWMGALAAFSIGWCMAKDRLV